MGKIYNVNLNYFSSNSGSETTNANYELDWYNLLPPNKAFKLTFSFQASINSVNNFRFPYITTNILGYSYANATNGFNNSYILGTLKLYQAFSNNYGYYCSSTTDNPPIYLDSRPTTSTLNVKILDNINRIPFVDAYFSTAGAGTATQNGFILTIVTITAGQITLGTIITISGIPRKILAFGTGTGGVGNYIVSNDTTINSATAFTFPADLDGSSIAPYILTLSFEEIDK
jgi:hypothetical protein